MRQRDPKARLPELHPDPPPRAILYLWGWFLELDSTRDIGGMGVRAIRYAEIQAWAALTGRSPRPEEIALIVRIDRLAVAISREKD